MKDLLLHILFYLSALAMAIVCVYTAKNMSTNTCKCIRVCFMLILLGLIGLVMAIWYDWNKELSLLAVMPTFWGITGWLLFDRYRAHEKMRHIYDEILLEYKRLKRRFLGEEKEIAE
jgi:positive regulator of sigma E activity